MSGPPDVSLPHDRDLLYLTDNAYFALLDHESGNRVSSNSKNKPDGLFLERLESFLEGQQKEMESFANREQRPLHEIRKLVAIPHASYIFSLDPSLPHPNESPQDTITSTPSIRGTISRLSNTLQMLHEAAGLDSLLLVVSPHPTPPPTTLTTPVNADSGNCDLPSMLPESFETSWIGGTDLGKEFWMGMKGGGLNGARAFRLKCQMRLDAEVHSDMDCSTAATSSNCLHTPIQTPAAGGFSMIKMRSGDVKTELNAAVRHALRSVSGNPSAEMRWTKPASLEESYNVRLVGWPPGVDMRNPSNNSLKDNRLLLDLVRSGRMKFVRKGSTEWNASPLSIQQVNPASTKETVSQNNHSAAPPTVSPPPPVVDSLTSPALPIDTRDILQQSSQFSTHIPNSLCYPSSLSEPRPAEAVNVVAAFSRNFRRQSSAATSLASSNLAPKRPIEEPGRVTQKGSKVKRAKHNSADGAV